MTFFRRFLRIALLAGSFHALLLLCGCAGSLFNMKPLPEMTPETLLEKIGEHAGRLKTFQGRGLFTIASEEGAFRGEIRIVTRRPDSLWFKLEGPLGIDMVTVRVAAGRFAFYSPWMKTSVRDSMNQMDFRRMLPAGLDSLDVLTGLLCMPELNPGSFDSTRSLSKEKGHYVLNVGSSESLWVEPRGPVISRWEKRDGEGKTVWLYEADLFRNSGEVRLPKRIRFTESEKRELIVYYEDIKVNQPLKRGWSDVRLPKGAETKTL